jgi:RNA-directed DNA polymerase
MIDKNPEKYFKRIQVQLEDKVYSTSEYHEFVIEDRGKCREICDLPYYPDRIVHWALMLQIEPILISTFINTTYAAIPGRGAHMALQDITECLTEDVKGTKYCAKLDVHKFFPSIDHEVLKELIRRKVKCKDTLWLIDEIIDSYTNSLTGKGVPIGNYPSQYFGNFYLTYFDHWLKETLFEFETSDGQVEYRRLHYYFRYMDDMVLLSDSKEFLHFLIGKIREYLKTQLHLSLKGNYQVFPVDIRGIDFVGYRNFRTYILLRTSTKKRLRKAMKTTRKCVKEHGDMTEHQRCVIASYSGVLKWCDGHRLYAMHIHKVLKYIKIIEEEDCNYEIFC